MLRYAMALMVLAVVLACGGSQEAGKGAPGNDEGAADGSAKTCTTHTDCAADQYCANSPNKPQWLCAECGGKCDCRSDSDCTPGTFCGDQGRCVAPAL